MRLCFLRMQLPRSVSWVVKSKMFLRDPFQAITTFQGFIVFLKLPQRFTQRSLDTIDTESLRSLKAALIAERTP